MLRRFASFKLPRLPFAPDSLEPEYTANTISFHHGKHHQAYVNNLNAATQGKAITLLDAIINDSQAGPAIRNNAGGHYNHSLFWLCLGKDGGNEPTGQLRQDIEKSFGTLDEFKDKFSKAAITQFGSGWAMLVRNQKGLLEIRQTPNQDNPLMRSVHHEYAIPFFTIDVWEHAYYLDYQNRRPDYCNAFWNIVHWRRVEQMYKEFALNNKPVDVEHLLDQLI